MNYRKHGVKALCLTILAALGLMAFTTTGAQASGTFLIQEPKGGSWTEETFAGAMDALKTKLTVLNLNLELFCQSGWTYGTIKPNGHGHLETRLEQCYVSGINGAGELQGGNCQLEESPIYFKALILVILHRPNLALAAKAGNEDKAFLLFTPLDGLTFLKILNHSECVIPETTSIKGSFVGKIVGDSHEAFKLIETNGMLTLFPTHKLLFGTSEAHFDFFALLSLSGVNELKKWGAA